MDGASVRREEVIKVVSCLTLKKTFDFRLERARSIIYKLNSKVFDLGIQIL